MGAVPMMDIPIENKNSLQRIAVKGIAGGNRHVIEEAKSHGFFIFRMMAWRPHCAENRIDNIIDQIVNTAQASPNAVNGGGIGLRSDDCIAAI